jgi:phosphatidylinositol glycan class C protein
MSGSLETLSISTGNAGSRASSLFAEMREARADERRRSSHSNVGFEVADQTEMGTPGGLRNGVLLQHRFCPWDGTEYRPLSSTCPVCGAARTRSRYSGNNDKVLAQLLKPPWERVLWKKQPYEDNYVDRTFLESLVTNANFYQYDAWQITKDSIVVTQHLAGTAIFLACTYLTNYQQLSLAYMLALDVMLALGGGCTMVLIWLYRSWTLTGSRGARSPPLQFLAKVVQGLSLETCAAQVVVYLRSTLLFVVALCTLSPILRTLTITISDDTLAAWSTIFLMVNLFCHDYRWVNGRGNSFEGSVSLNAAMFVSVMLASRAPGGNTHVALLMCSAVEIFALAPRVYRYCRRRRPSRSLCVFAGEREEERGRERAGGEGEAWENWGRGCCACGEERFAGVRVCWRFIVHVQRSGSACVCLFAGPGPSNMVVQCMYMCQLPPVRRILVNGY